MDDDVEKKACRRLWDKLPNEHTLTKKNIRFSILDLAIVAQGSSLQQTFAHALQLAQNAEALGYTRYWLAEHHNCLLYTSRCV